VRLFPDLSQDQEFNSLADQGYAGTMDDKQKAYLSNAGLSGTISDMKAAWYKGNLFSSTSKFFLDFINGYYRSNNVQSTLASTTTFARSGNATMFDSTGTLVTVADGVPREGSHLYEGGAWANNGLQLESEARTNLLSYSQDYTNGVWLKGSNVTVSGNTDISPDGSQNADRLYEAATTASHVTVSEVVSFSLGDSHTASIYAKNAPGGRGLLQLSFYQALSGNVTTYANFDLINGVVTVESGCTATMEDVGNGFYRCRLTFVQGGRTSERVNLGLINSTTAGAFQSYVGDTSKAIILGGLQFEAGSTPSSYIPTAGSTVTRAAETLTASAANLPWPTPVETTGIELVTNGNFATGISGWTFNNDNAANMTTVWAPAGYMSVSRGAGSALGSPTQSLPLETNKVYSISVRVEGTQRAFWNVIAGGTLVSTVTNAGNTTETRIVRTTTSNAGVIQIWTDNNKTTFVDDITVKEINPLAVSLQISGKITYADTNELFRPFPLWPSVGSNYIGFFLDTRIGDTGQVGFEQATGSVGDSVASSSTTYSPGLNVPFNIASRHGSTFINGAVSGTVLTANTTPIALPDLSAQTLNISSGFMGHINKFGVWDVDIGDSGIVREST
jgi:hypothetical protein